MASENSVCMGCFVNNPANWQIPDPTCPVFVECNGLTFQEKECLKHLADAWNIFIGLSAKHPQDNSEFCTAIHDAQKLIAMRVARRVDKDIWTQSS